MTTAVRANQTSANWFCFSTAGRAAMRTFASIRNRPTWIRGWSHSGWSGAAPSAPGAKQLPFGFDITDDGAGNYLLVCFSCDGVYGADTWHETLDEAFASAEEQFGIQRQEWGPPIT